MEALPFRDCLCQILDVVRPRQDNVIAYVARAAVLHTCERGKVASTAQRVHFPFTSQVTGPEEVQAGQHGDQHLCQPKQGACGVACALFGVPLAPSPLFFI